MPNPINCDKQSVQGSAQKTTATNKSELARLTLISGPFQIAVQVLFTMEHWATPHTALRYAVFNSVTILPTVTD